MKINFEDKKLSLNSNSNLKYAENKKKHKNQIEKFSKWSNICTFSIL